MGALRLVLAATLAIASTPANASPIDRWQPFIAEASRRFEVPERIIVAVMRAESGGRTMLYGRPIISRAGAMGLMQLMPGTWAEMRTALQLGRDPYDPHDNILAGTLYLKRLRDRFGYPGMIAAYNAGPGRYAAYIAGRERLPAETASYLKTVTGGGPASPIRFDTPPPQLMFVLRHDLGDAPQPANQEEKVSVFAIRKVLP